jgi:hypothetical protein
MKISHARTQPKKYIILNAVKDLLLITELSVKADPSFFRMTL